jgi:NSS family neurotransmitter:Na+ symporter
MREQWGTRGGFILSTIGAAVGLGNIWRFAYVAGENGGGAFLVVYLVLVVAIGLPLVVAELAVGKRGAADAVTAFEALAPRSAWRHAGWFGVIGAAIILSYYGVIAGWALRYFTAAGTGSLWEAATAGYGGYFSRFIADPGQPVGWQFAMMLATMFVVAGGIGRGIERLNLVLMPLLAAIVVALAGYALTLPGAWGGVAFLFAPDWAALLDPRVIAAALGQAFFSIGVGMAVFVTYGGYMHRDFAVPTSAAVIVAGDTVFALVAGLAIFPAVFAFGGDPAAGPELAFITLPQVFLAMPGGAIVGTVFFFLLSAAALTSMVSLLEVSVATVIHRLNLSRWRATALVGAAVFLLGVPSALSYGVLGGITIFGLPIFDAVDRAVSDLLLPVAGLVIALFFGWIVPRDAATHLAELGHGRLARAFFLALRVVPVFIVALIVSRFVG